MVCRSQEAFRKSAVEDHKDSHRAEGVGSRRVERASDRLERDRRLEVASGHQQYLEKEEDDTLDAPMGPLRAFSLCLVGPATELRRPDTSNEMRNQSVSSVSYAAAKQND